MDKEIYEFEIARNAEGGILATAGIKGADTSYRIAGPKAWGGSSKIAKIDISQHDLVEFVLCYAPGAYAEIVAYDQSAAAPQVAAKLPKWIDDKKGNAASIGAPIQGHQAAFCKDIAAAHNTRI